MSRRVQRDKADQYPEQQSFVHFSVRGLVMRTISAPGLAPSTKLQGNAMSAGAIHCIDAARGIWPVKTAEHWAAAAGVEVRMAKYWLAGRVSERGKIALIRLLI